MGEIAEMMLDGTLCEGCGVYMPGEGYGVPRRCRDCRPSKKKQKAMNVARHEAEQAAAKKHPCPVCGKRLRKVGMQDHIRDAHPPKETNMAPSDHGQYSGVVDIARNGIDEVIRLKAQVKQDEALILQLVEALDGVHPGEHQGGVDEAIAAGRARLQSKSITSADL